jgi:aldose 1-epimerase
VLNLTNHTYFNLAGSGSILGEHITIYGSRITPVDSGLIPTGQLMPVQGTPFDFTVEHVIGERINAENQQIKYAKGYDHNWVLDVPPGQTGLHKAAMVFDPESGRTLTVLTTQPGVQFYTGNFLDGTKVGKNKDAYAFRSGLCLETQHFPDSPNHPNFPTTELKPGQTFHSQTVFEFSVRK